MSPDDVTWKDAEAWFAKNPGDLIRHMADGKKLKAALRELLLHGGDCPFRKQFRAIGLEVFTEMFYSDPAWQERYDQWREEFARRAT